jgi:ATP-dependent RNA helicase RhlE
VIRALGADAKIRSETVYGGVGLGPQIRALREGVEIIIACPGRLLDLLQQGYGRLDKVDTLVLDEADRMFDMGFLPSIQKIMRKLPRQRQTMLFSATFPPEIEKLATQEMHDPQRIAVGLSRPAYTVAHALYPIQASAKTPLLLEILRKTDAGSVLVFTRTKHRAERLTQHIARAGFRVSSLHGDRSQGQRQRALDGFRGGDYQILVATDIAARGLDVESISHVINYDMPDTADAYIHRIGRTGRAARTGDAYTLVTPEDADMVRTLEKVIGNPLPRTKLDGFDYEAPPETPYIPKPAHTQQRWGGRRSSDAPQSGRRPQRPSASQPSPAGMRNQARGTVAQHQPATSLSARPALEQPTGNARAQTSNRPSDNRPNAGFQRRKR